LTAEKWHIGNPDFASDSICTHHRVWPWSGHRLFGYDLVRFLKPERVVELGTYWGTSFFTFCQAVKDENLVTELVAVDTWEGDEHTGAYENDAFENVQATLLQCFPELHVNLMRQRFDEAVQQIDDDSIDLLHIDGCHTYEAVQDDYISWLPKLRENGVILFHDIADSCDYGSVTFWNQLRETLPGFSFQHSWGLGVLFPKGDKVYRQLTENNFNDKLLIYEYLSELNLMRILKDAHEERGDKQDALIKHQESVINEITGKNKELQIVVERGYSSLLWKTLKRFRQITGVKSV
jgi:hypothetical protein